MALTELIEEPTSDGAPPPPPASGAHLSYAGASRVLTAGNAATVEMFGNLERGALRRDRQEPAPLPRSALRALRRHRQRLPVCPEGSHAVHRVPSAEARRGPARRVARTAGVLRL